MLIQVRLVADKTAFTLYNQCFYLPICMQSVGRLTAFFTPARSIIKTATQIVGGADFEGMFNTGTLLYLPVAYILFVVFLVLMPVLFRAMLVRILLKAHSQH